MTYRLEGKTDIVIDGWDLGIADDPYTGTSDLRSANVLSVPGEVSVNFKTAAMNIPPTVTTLAFTVDTTTDTFTVAATTSWYNGMAITLNSIVTSTGISTGRVYWVGDVTATTFKLYKNPNLNAGMLVDVTGSNGSGTMSSYTVGKFIDKIIYPRGTAAADYPFSQWTFFIDNAGRAWWVRQSSGVTTSNLIYLGNDTLTGSVGRAINIYKGYLIVFRTSTMDALQLTGLRDDVDLDGGSGWAYGWESISASSFTPRPTLTGQDDIMYYDNSERVGSISENIGSTFNPSSGATYTENTAALDLPRGEEVTALGELGVDLLVGTQVKKVYPWDRTSPSFRVPIDLPEANVRKILSTNQVAYVFAGERGRIYRTTGTTADEWKKIPDHISGYIEPYYSWNDIELSRNQVYFGFTATQNDRTAITGMGGVWAIDISSGMFRHVHQLSAGASAAVSMISRNPHSDDGVNPYFRPAGTGLYVGWDNSGTYGMDEGSSNPYSSYETVIKTEMIPIGTYVFPTTPTMGEFKLSRPLVSGESVRISYRTNLTEAFTSWFTESTVGAISGASDIPFESAQWVQLQAELSSTNTTPSKVPLKELRLRLP